MLSQTQVMGQLNLQYHRILIADIRPDTSQLAGIRTNTEIDTDTVTDTNTDTDTDTDNATDTDTDTDTSTKLIYCFLHSQEWCTFTSRISYTEI